MKSLKTYLIAGLVVIFVLMSIGLNHFYAKLKEEKARSLRLWQNNVQLLAENNTQVSLILTQKEFARVMSDSTKSLLKRLQIAPKTVTQIVEKTITVHDTIKKDVFVYPLGDKQWKISDRDKCWKWEAVAKLIEDSLIVNRTGFDYKNQSTDVFFHRLKWKFLFIKVYSKEIIQNTVSECGVPESRIITVIKN
jgi:hypothetical protein